MSAFNPDAPLFEAFLKGMSNPSSSNGAQQNLHFIARNFLLEERLDPMRVASYEAQLGGAAPTDFAAWDVSHTRYLKEHVFLRPPGVHDFRIVDRNNPKLCPESFRAPRGLLSLRGTDLTTPLLRVVPVDDIASMARSQPDQMFDLDKDQLFDLGKRVIANPHDAEARRDLKFVFDEAFNGPINDHRPMFAAFYQDLHDELAALPNDQWANRLRNRLGLLHISQLYAPGLPRRVFIFRYEVREIPTHPGQSDRRPLALPLVIDHKLFPAFCPAPGGMNSGRTLNLKDGGDDDPVREVLHLRMPLQVEHLIAAGEVTEPVSESLRLARRDHLFLLQILSNRNDYGAETDLDLLV